MTLDNDIKRAVHAAIDEPQTPGAVVLIGRRDEVLYHEAFGHRMIAPEQRPMQRNTIFDLASLTKPIATATAIMQLVERGELALDDPACRYIPEFTGEGRQTATIRHLLTHSAGLTPYKNYLNEWGQDLPPAERRPRVVADICNLPLEHPVGEGFLYTCLGYILLASIVEVVSGQPLDEFAAEHIFAPLGMSETRFNPPADVLSRCAATEQLPEGTLVGVVHDENARYLSGVGGNAGLFSTASDLSRYMRALLGEGALEGARILSSDSVALMLSPQLEASDTVRSLAWSVRSASYSPVVSGDLFPAGSISHSGYTGTSICADPASRTYVILLTNRVHLGRDKDVSRLRREVANIAAAALL